MQRLVDESEYVLGVLYRMRGEVSANPELFDPNAQERVDEAIARMEHVLRSTWSHSMIQSVEQRIKAAWLGGWFLCPSLWKTAQPKELTGGPFLQHSWLSKRLTLCICQMENQAITT
jgi:hypothetical protein